MTRSRRINAPRVAWTDAMLVTLRAGYPDRTAADVAAELGLKKQQVYSQAHRMRLRKSAEFFALPASARLDGVRGAGTRFLPGNVPWTAGQKGLHLSPATQFKPGSAPVNVQAVGALRINTLGDIDIKLAPGKNQWVSLRRYAWALVHGPIAPGMVVEVLNGDGHDTQIENLELVTRREHLDRHLLKKYPNSVRRVMQVSGRLKNMILKKKETGNEHTG